MHIFVYSRIMIFFAGFQQGLLFLTTCSNESAPACLELYTLVSAELGIIYFHHVLVFHRNGGRVSTWLNLGSYIYIHAHPHFQVAFKFSLYVRVRFVCISQRFDRWRIIWLTVAI